MLRGALVCAVVLPFVDAPARCRHVRVWAQRMLRRLGITLDARGELHPAPVLLLPNHVSWLDIVALDAIRPTRFVAKSAMRHWPVLGLMMASAGTIFIERERKRDALRVVHQVAAALEGGATVGVFAEGTTGDGRQLLPFHANLLQAAVSTATPVQPVVLRFADAQSAFSAAALYLGETTLLRSLWRIALADALIIHVGLLPALPSEGSERRALAAAARTHIQDVLDAAG